MKDVETITITKAEKEKLIRVAVNYAKALDAFGVTYTEVIDKTMDEVRHYVHRQYGNLAFLSLYDNYDVLDALSKALSK